MNAARRLLQSLEIGGRGPLLVRREKIPHFDLGKRILFASDLHLRKDGPRHVIEGILDIVLRERPDVILLGGDLVDWRSGLEPLRCLMAGNHDRWIGVDSVRDAVLGGGGHWLEDQPLRWNPDSVAYGSAKQELLSAHCHVLCAHDPPPPVTRAGFQLVLSGHLHGGQFVLYEHDGRLYPGAFAYRWNGLRFQENSGTLLVSRGVRDTLPVRWNCPREVLAVDL
jgi:predicted MPP superfamily phosphohydrolase